MEGESPPVNIILIEARQRNSWMSSVQAEISSVYGDDEVESLCTSSGVMELRTLKGEMWWQWSLQQLHLSPLERECENSEL